MRKTLLEHGWCEVDQEDDHIVYSKDFAASYEGACYVWVCDVPAHFEIVGDYGVAELEIAAYSCSMPYGTEHLNDMLAIIKQAENELIYLGIPFVLYYEFHGDHQERWDKRHRNCKIRSILNLCVRAG